LNYEGTLLVYGLPLNQYAMHEDEDGYFYLLTKDWRNRVATHLYVASPEFKLVGKLLNIEPGEEFKASRFLGDKLYLVTFKQVDPLFVIDLADKTKPKII